MTQLLILCEYPTLSGGERSMLVTFDGVARAGFDVHVMAPGQGPLALACRERRIPLVPFPTANNSQSNVPLAERREHLAGVLTRRRPDLLHANSLAMGRLAGPVAADRNVPSLAHLRDIIKLSARAIRDLNANRRLLTVSKATRQFHVAAGLAADKTFVLYNGIDLNQFQPRTPTGYLHRELGIPMESPLVGSIGQICLRKAQDVLLNAAVRLGATAGLPSSANVVGQTVPDTPLPAARCPLPAPHWLIIGQRWSDKPESRRFEERLHAVARRLGPLVHFLGPRDDVPRLLGELTLLVHTARQEPLGRVLLEAAASGTPVVATDVGGTREIFPPESASARLVPPDNPEALAAAIAELLSRPDDRLALGVAARRRAEAQFDAARATTALVDHYRATACGE